MKGIHKSGSRTEALKANKKSGRYADKCGTGVYEVFISSGIDAFDAFFRKLLRDLNRMCYCKNARCGC